MSQPPYQPGDEPDEFEQAPDGDIGGDPNWDVPQYNPDGTPYHNPGPSGTVSNETNTQPTPFAKLDELNQIAYAAVTVCQNNSYERDGKTYLKVEAWNGIAWLCGMIIGTEPTVDKMIAGVVGIAARSTLKTASGKLLSHAEGFVGQDEQWWSQPVSDRINIAQTRAVGRICRHILSIVVTTMNHNHGTKFEVTPYEELQRASQPLQIPNPPGLGQRHPMPSPSGPPSGTIPYEQRYAQWPATAVPPQPQQGWNPGPQGPQPAPQNVVPYAPPNQAPSVGQQGETWQGMLSQVEVKMISTKRGQSQLFLVYLSDGRNASTFDKTIAANAQGFVGRNVEMLVVPRGQGRYNVGQLRPL